MTDDTVARAPQAHTHSMSRTTCIALSAIAASLLLGGCSGGAAPTPTPKHAPQAAASTHVKTPWDSLLKDEAKAKNVQKIVNQHAKRQQQALKQQTQP